MLAILGKLVLVLLVVLILARTVYWSLRIGWAAAGVGAIMLLAVLFLWAVLAQLP